MEHEEWGERTQTVLLIVGGLEIIGLALRGSRIQGEAEVVLHLGLRRVVIGPDVGPVGEERALGGAEGAAGLAFLGHGEVGGGGRGPGQLADDRGGLLAGVGVEVEGQVDALVGVTYQLAGNTLIPLCNGSPVLDACWVEGAYVAATDTGALTPALPGGVDPSAVRGLRISAQNANGTNWEQPINPQLIVPFQAVQREFLIYGPDGGSDTPVPSTQPGLPTAPGTTRM